MQKKFLIIFISIFIFIGCKSTDIIQTDIDNGATAVDGNISGLQQQQDTSDTTAQDITDTGQDIAETSNDITNTSNDIANSIDGIVNQLESGKGNSSEFADIVRRIQARGSIDYIDTSESNTNPNSQGAEKR